MLSIIIVVLILVGLTVHRYLSLFWEQGLLPYSMGFLFFANLFAGLYLINFIWMFGWLSGVIIFFLTYFQAIYSAGLWIFLLPGLLSIHRNLTMPKVNPIAYGGFSFLVVILGVLTVINFPVSRYMSIWKILDYNYKMFAFIFFVVLAVGNVARLSIMSKLMK